MSLRDCLLRYYSRNHTPCTLHRTLRSCCISAVRGVTYVFQTCVFVSPLQVCTSARYNARKIMRHLSAHQHQLSDVFNGPWPDRWRKGQRRTRLSCSRHSNSLTYLRSPKKRFLLVSKGYAKERTSDSYVQAKREYTDRYSLRYLKIC